MAAGIAGLAALRAQPSFAQEIILPDLAETLALLESEAGIRLIYARYSLAFSITFDLRVRLSGAESGDPGPTVELPVFPDERPESEDPFRMLIELRDLGRRRNIIEYLSGRADPLSERRGEKLSSLLNQIAAALPDAGFFFDGPAVAEAFASCGHVERFAAVMRDTSSETSYFCGRFPFTLFC